MDGARINDDERGEIDDEHQGSAWRQILALGEHLHAARLKYAADEDAYSKIIRTQRELIISTAQRLLGANVELWISSGPYPSGPASDLIARAYETNQTCYSSADLGEPHTEEQELIHYGDPGDGVACAVAISLLPASGRTGEAAAIAVLHVSSSHGETFSQFEIQLINELAIQAGIATQTAHDMNLDAGRFAQYSTLLEVSKAITSILDQEQLLTEVVNLIQKRFGHPYVHLFSVHQGRRMIFYEAGSGERSQSLWQEHHALDLDDPDGIIPWVGRHGQTVLSNDVSGDSRYRPTPFPRDETASELTIPLIFGGKVLGILDVQSDQRDAFDSQDRYLLEALADNVAIALRNAYLYRSEQWRRQVADSLRDVAGLLSAEASLDQVLEAVLVELERTLPCDLAAIWLLDENGASDDPGGGIPPLRLAATRGLGALVMDLEVGQRLDEVLSLNASSGAGVESELDASWLVDALESDTPLIRSPRSSTDFLGDAVGFSSDYSAIAAPLNVGTQNQGVLTLFHHTLGRYGREARSMTAAFASYAAVAIENTRLYEAAHEQAWISTVMLQVAEATQTFSDLSGLLDTIVRITPTVAGVRACLLYLLEGDRVFVPATASGLNQSQQLEFERCRFSREDIPALDSLLEDRGAVLLDEETDDWRLASILYVDLDTESLFTDELLVLVPLLAHDEVLGTFLISYSVDLFVREDGPTLDSFYDEQLPIIQGIAHQTAAAIENTRLLRAQREEAYVSVALLQVAQSVVSKRDLGETLESIVRITPILVGVKRTAIYLYDARSAVYHLAQAYGLSREAEGYQFVQDEFPLLDAVRESHRFLALPAIRDWEESEDIHDAWTQLPAPSADEVDQAMESESPMMAVFPLSVQDEFLGVLLIEEPEPMPLDVLAGESSLSRQRAKRLEITTGISQQASLAIQNARLQQEMVARERMERELQLARDIQRTFLPQDLPDLPGWDLSARWQPAHEVGGDFYDYFMLPGGRFGIVIADVADKGMPAALYMTLIRTLIRATLYEVDSPTDVLARVNDVLEAETEQGMFVTLFYGVLSLESGQLVYTNAGHNPPYWLHRKGGELEPLLKSGMALGVLEGNRVEERSITMQPGDYLILYTDGITEAVSQKEQFYGEERLVETILNAAVSLGDGLSEVRDLPALNLVDAIEESVGAYTSSAPLSDDLTLVVIKCEMPV
jgi:serine phosphatase RsbU (regulator of sigma subunit)